MKPKVSVIVPVYNGEKHLNQCIESIVNQTLKEIEIILIDDGSSDGSVEILREWQKKDSRIHVIENENHGTGYTINVGIKLARGEYIAEVDCDDFIDLDMYEHLYSISEGADVVRGGYYSYFEGKSDLPYSLVETKSVFCPVKLNWQQRYLVFGFQPSFWAGIYKTEFIKKNKLYWNETEGASFQDTSIIFKINALCKKMVWSERSFYHWRVGEEHSITSTKWPLAVLREYRVMEDFLMERPKLALYLRDILSRLRFGTYSWNYGRIKPEDKHIFADLAAGDFKRDLDFIDSRLYSREKMDMYLLWTADFEKFYELSEKHRKETEGVSNAGIQE